VFVATSVFITGRFSGPGRAVGPVCVCVCVCVDNDCELNDLWCMRICRAGSSLTCLGQVQRSRSKFKGHRRKTFLFWLWIRLVTRRILVVCQVRHAKVVSSTSSGGFVVFSSFT